MPYIKQINRAWCDVALQAEPDDAGDLNYTFTIIAHAYLERQGKSYQAFNDIIGALEGCKLELYRRKVAPYEDGKIEENGDVG